MKIITDRYDYMASALESLNENKLLKEELRGANALSPRIIPDTPHPVD